MTGKQKALDKAVNEAIFIEQLTSDKAVKFVLNRMRGMNKEEVSQAINDAMIWYKLSK